MQYIASILIFGLIFTSCVFPIFSQVPKRKKTKIKNFGSSLKQTNDPKQKSSAPKESANDDVIKINTNLVVLDCLVVDADGKTVNGLKAEDFSISEDGQAQQIDLFSLGDDTKVPRSIVLVIDYSGSQKPYIERSVEAAKLLVDKLRPNDLMAVVTDDVELIVQFTADKNKLKKELNSLKRKGFITPHVGQSKQFSALYATLNEMFDETDVRPIVVFQTDGDQFIYLKDHFGTEIDGMSEEAKANFTSQELLDLANKSRASIYSILVGEKLTGLSEEEKNKKRESKKQEMLKYWGIDSLTPEEAERERQSQIRTKQYYPDGLPDEQEFMSNLSQQNGGWMEFLEKPEQAEGIYTRILSELNTRYIIGYSPTNETKDGKRRSVKIEIKNHPEYKILGKTSYIPQSAN